MEIPKIDTKKYDFFPFSTCEKPNKTGIAQPYSVIVNIISIFVILFFLFQTKNIYAFGLILSLLAFECVHTFSHIIHLPNYLQINIIHSLVYAINFFYLLAFYHFTHKAPSIFFSIVLIILLAFDIYAFLFLSFIFYFSSSLLLFFSILIYYYNYIPKNKQSYIFIILSLGITIMLLFYNEYYNCKKMLEVFPNFPFHAILEITGLFILYFICKFFSGF
jgi:hypothetical protein